MLTETKDTRPKQNYQNEQEKNLILSTRPTILANQVANVNATILKNFVIQLR